MRMLMSAAVAAVALALGGCGSSSDVPSAEGPFGKRPNLTLPSSAPGDFSSTVISDGSGRALKAGDLVQAHFIGKNWRGGTVVGESYKNGAPIVFSLGGGQLLPGWEEGLVGKKVGSRVVIVTPPDKAFGEEGNKELGVAATDTLAFAFDILNAFDGTSEATGTPVSSPAGLPVVSTGTGKPKITIPAGYDAPVKLVVQPLRTGAGATVKKGDTILAQYVGVNARTGKEFDASWGRGQPAAFQIGNGQVIKAWDTGIVGRKEGDRILLVVPPSQGYGSAGNAQAGIRGTDTLVFVVDILVTQSGAPAAG